MSHCYVPRCNHRALHDPCKLYRFPKDLGLLKKWETLCRRIDRPPTYQTSRICSCHFVDGKKENGPTIFQWSNGKTRRAPEGYRSRGTPFDDPEHPDFAPSLNLPHLKTSPEVQEFRAKKKLDRWKRLQKRRRVKLDVSQVPSSTHKETTSHADGGMAQQSSTSESLTTSRTSNEQLADKIAEMFKDHDYAAKPKIHTGSGQNRPRHPIAWRSVTRKLPESLVYRLHSFQLDPNDVIFRSERSPSNATERVPLSNLNDGTKPAEKVLSSNGLKGIARRDGATSRKSVSWKDQRDGRRGDSEGNGSSTDTDEEGQRETWKQLAAEASEEAKRDAARKYLWDSSTSVPALNNEDTFRRDENGIIANSNQPQPMDTSEKDTIGAISAVQSSSLRKLISDPDILSNLNQDDTQNRTIVVLDGPSSSPSNVVENTSVVDKSTRNNTTADDDVSSWSFCDGVCGPDGSVTDQVKGEVSLVDLPEDSYVADGECVMDLEGASGELIIDSRLDDSESLTPLEVDNVCSTARLRPSLDGFQDQSADQEATSNQVENNSEYIPENCGPTVDSFGTLVQCHLSERNPSDLGDSATRSLEADESSNPESRAPVRQLPSSPVILNPPDTVHSFFELLEQMYRTLLPHVQTFAEENLFFVMKQANKMNEDLLSGLIERT